MRVFKGTISNGEERVIVLRFDGTENAHAIVVDASDDLSVNEGGYRIIGDAQNKIQVGTVLYRKCKELFSKAELGITPVTWPE